MKKGREIFIIVLVLSIPLLHEVGHLVGYIIEGVPATIKYGFITSEKVTLLGVLGGTLFNILLSLICIALIYLDNKRKNIWGAIGLASSVSRLINCGIIFLIGVFSNPVVLQNNDEGQLSILMNSPIYFQYIIFLVIYLLLTILIIKRIEDNKLCKKITFRIIVYNLILTIGLIFF